MTDKKILNLDILTTEKQYILLGGKEYEMNEVSVLDLLSFWKDIDGQDQKQQIEKTIAFFYKVIPSAVSEKLFDALNLQQVNALLTEIVGKIENEHIQIGEKVAQEESKKK